MTRLTEIANKYNTDKGTVAYEKHGYTEEYSHYIPEKGYFQLLEIGIYKGDSVKMWVEYNKLLHVIALDIDSNCLKYIPEIGWGYDLYIGDATKKDFIDYVFSRYLPEEDVYPNFIIDDGSHNYVDILNSFKLLFPKLKEKGYYFIEDLHAGHAQKNRLVEDICKWLHEEKIEYKNLGFFCNEKLWILGK